MQCNHDCGTAFHFQIPPTYYYEPLLKKKEALKTEQE